MSNLEKLINEKLEAERQHFFKATVHTNAFNGTIRVIVDDTYTNTAIAFYNIYGGSNGYTATLHGKNKIEFSPLLNDMFKTIIEKILEDIVGV